MTKQKFVSSINIRTNNWDSDWGKALRKIQDHYNLEGSRVVKRAIIDMVDLLLARRTEILAQIELEKKQLLEKELKIKTGGI